MFSLPKRLSKQSQKSIFCKITWFRRDISPQNRDFHNENAAIWAIPSHLLGCLKSYVNLCTEDRIHFPKNSLNIFSGRAHLLAAYLFFRGESYPKELFLTRKAYFKRHYHRSEAQHYGIIPIFVAKFWNISLLQKGSIKQILLWQKSIYLHLAKR